MDKFREFWLNKATGNFEMARENVLLSDPRRSIIHVIEYSAYEQLKQDLEECEKSHLQLFNTAVMQDKRQENKELKQAFKTIHGNIFETPQWLFDSLNNEFNFEWDLACSENNGKLRIQ